MTTMKLSRPLGVFVVFVVVDFEVELIVWWDVRMQLSMRRWDFEMKGKKYENCTQLHKKRYFVIYSQNEDTKKLHLKTVYVFIRIFLYSGKENRNSLSNISIK